MHAVVKRYLRRKRVNELIQLGKPIPPQITAMDLGCSLPINHDDDDDDDNDDYDESNQNEIQQQSINANIESEFPINYNDGMALFRAGRPLQRDAQQYWMFEYIRRLVVQHSDQEVAFECVVLGCVDTERDLYAIYIYELGLEHRYSSEIGPLDPGRTLWLKVKTVIPRQRVLNLSLASSGAATNQQKRIIAARAA